MYYPDTNPWAPIFGVRPVFVELHNVWVVQLNQAVEHLSYLLLQKGILLIKINQQITVKNKNQLY